MVHLPFAIWQLSSGDNFSFVLLYFCCFMFLLFCILSSIVVHLHLAFCICPVVTMTQFFSYVPFFVLCLCLFVFLYFAIYCDAFGSCPAVTMTKVHLFILSFVLTSFFLHFIFVLHFSFGSLQKLKVVNFDKLFLH